MPSRRRQIMQPWPLCLMSFTQPKERSILPRHYTRVPSIARTSMTSSSLVQDCASNTTLLTNVSPFNSQVALAGNKLDHSNVTRHYYMENLKSQSELGKSQIYDPLGTSSDTLDPLLLVKNQLADTTNMREQKELVPKPVDNFEVSSTKVNYTSQVLAALSVSLGSMVVGFCCGYTSPALASMANNATTNFEVTQQTASWIGSALPLSALIGGISGGPCIEYLGRRNTILATAFPFIAAGIIIAMATNVAMILIGRVLSGFSVGIASLSLPVYLGETLQPEVRGTLGLLPTAFGNTGILVCFIAGMYLNWSNLALLGALLPVPFVVLMFFVPETPRWYISKGKTKMARKSLVWLRGKNTDVSDELTAIEKSHVESEKGDSQNVIFELFKGVYLKPLIICLGLMFFQQLSGINAVMFYTTNLFKETGSPISEDLSTVIIGVVNFVSTFIATLLIDRLGRKMLLYISSISMTITLVVLGTYLYLKQLGYHTEPYGWIPLASCIIYVTGFSLGFGPIPWLMMGEILPAKIRGSAASVATSLNWSCTFLVTKTFIDIMRLLGNYGTFWLFGTITFLGFVFTFMFVPETRGRSLEEIEKRLTGPVRRMSSVANMKPMPTAC